MPNPNDKPQRRDILSRAAEQAAALASGPEVPAVLRREDERGQTWDKRNRAVSLRIREVDDERLTTRAADLGLSKDALGAALVWAALDALDAGVLDLEVSTVQTEVVDKLDRRRIYAKRQGRPSWQPGVLPEGTA